jgi:hypothetical protein
MLRLLLIFILPSIINSVNYRQIFSSDYNNALEFISHNSALFLDCSTQYNTDAEVIIPVLFPEAIRYSIIRDYLETKSLELTYVYSGSVDFSIGYFQMKPSFVDSIEKTIRNYPEQLKKYRNLLIPEELPLTEIRKERIDRLKSIEYQIGYANCLYDITKILYPDIFNYEKSFQIKFISTAFNHGFLTGEKEILDFTGKAFFPLNGKNNSQRYIYHEISLYFYEKDLPDILRK